jgi:hypothetical protein
MEIILCPTLEAPRTLRWSLELKEIVTPLLYINETCKRFQMQKDVFNVREIELKNSF